MSTATMTHFDTLGYVEKSTKLGANEELAKFQARELEAVYDMAVANSNQRLDNELNNVATKSDLKDIKVVLKSDIQELRLEIQNVRLELLKWVVGVGATTIVAISGIMFTLLKFMH